MSRLFRQPGAGLSGYAALTLFALAYTAALALVLVPGQFVGKADLEIVAQENP